MPRRARLALALLTSACAAHPGSARDAQGGRDTGSVLRSSGAVPAFEPGPPLEATPLTSDPHWQRAARGDVIDLAQLADREGAAGLLAGVELGGTLGLTALSALPHADDAEIALGSLCELATRVPPRQSGLVLRAIQGILGRPVRPTERLDVEGLLTCDAALSRLGTSAELAPADHDRVLNSRALLEEWLKAR
jgi:hypothetical protein